MAVGDVFESRFLLTLVSLSKLEGQELGHETEAVDYRHFVGIRINKYWKSSSEMKGMKGEVGLRPESRQM